MAWTTPMTFVANTPLTAAQLNQQLRDNLNETAAAKATTEGALFVAAGPNSLVERLPVRDSNNGTGTTTSTSFANLSGGTNIGPSVTVTTGSRALVLFAVNSKNSSSSGYCVTSVEVSGASSIAPSDPIAVVVNAGAGDEFQGGTHEMYTTLTPGVNTFTMRYRVGAGTGTFFRRKILVIPL